MKGLIKELEQMIRDAENNTRPVGQLSGEMSDMINEGASAITRFRVIDAYVFSEKRMRVIKRFINEFNVEVDCEPTTDTE